MGGGSAAQAFVAVGAHSVQEEDGWENQAIHVFDLMVLWTGPDHQ